MFARSGGAIDLSAFLKSHRHIHFSRKAHQFLDAVAVRAFGDHEGIERAIGFERFANGVDTCEAVHRSESKPQRSSVAMACAAIASPRPIASTASLVFAFKLIIAGVMASDLASASRMAGKCGPSLGFSVITVASMCTIRKPCSASRS